MKRAGYLAVTLVLAVVAIVAFTVRGHAGGAMAIGAGIAWGVQAGSFWLLAGRLERGGPALRVWVLGIVLRFGVGLLVWLLAVLAGAPTRELMVAYGLALAAFLIVEAGWLAVAASRTTAGGT